MKTRFISSIVASLLALSASTVLPSQQSTQPTQVQAQPVPCVTTPTTPNPSGNGPAIKVPSKWRAMLDKERQKIEAKTGFELPDVATDIEQASKPKPKPCLPQVSSPKTAQPIPVLHIPIGVTTTWLCNPIITSTDPSHTVTFITPDALTSAEPAQPGTFEADGAKADPKATVSCANLRRDPKNNKVFLAN
jgi:hypothetical protein